MQEANPQRPGPTDYTRTDDAPFWATTSSRLGKGECISDGTQDPCHCHRSTQPHHAAALGVLKDAIRRAPQSKLMKGPHTRTMVPVCKTWR